MANFSEYTDDKERLNLATGLHILAINVNISSSIATGIQLFKENASKDFNGQLVIYASLNWKEVLKVYLSTIVIIMAQFLFKIHCSRYKYYNWNN